MRDKVSIAVPALDRASTDDKRIFGQVIKGFDNAYSIQTKHGVLDRNYPTSGLMSLPDTIELGIPNLLQAKISLSILLRPSKVLPRKYPCIVNAKMSENGVSHDVAHLLKPR